jgi:16S rRNA (guanine527-N7)-methyltransferase
MKNFDRNFLSQVLAEGIDEMQLKVSPEQQGRLMDYLALMFKWNSVYNLTSLRDPMYLVTHHLL